jgi:L-ribulose-5-phosphate 3-epimerase
MFVSLGKDPDAALGLVVACGLSACEVYTEDLSSEAEEALRRARERHGVKISAVFTMGPGPMAWDFVDGPSTNGLVPKEWRRPRIDRLKAAADFCRRLDVPALETHAGFIPENPKDPLYAEIIAALKEAVGFCRERGRLFLYHAGAETAVAMLRVIEDVGLDNQGVGLDTANPILYGTGNPCDALEVYGRHVRAVNVKDGVFPTDPRKLGRETPIGQGKVDFPRVVRKLRDLGYSAPIIIEREISGPELVGDVRKAKVYLEDLLAKEY